jgi:hypothetical protein
LIFSRQGGREEYSHFFVSLDYQPPQSGRDRIAERISPALEHVDSSSGAIGSAVNRAIDALVEIIASAPADAEIRNRWLDRLRGIHTRRQHRRQH